MWIVDTMHTLFLSLIALLPVIALFSGMAMTPVLAVIAIIASLYARRLPLATVRSIYLPMALLLVWPLVTVVWSITPEHSLSVALKVITLCAIGLVAVLNSMAIPPAGPRTIRLLSIAFIGCALLLIQEKILSYGLIHWGYDQLGLDYWRFMLKNVNRGLCALVVLVWPLMMVLTPRGRLLVLVPLCVSVMLMHSLSAKIGLIAAIVVYIAVRRLPRLASHAVVMLPPLFLLSFPVLYAMAEPTFFASEAVRAHLPPSAIQRLDIWSALLDYSSRHEVLGWGMDTTRAMPMTTEELTRIGLTEPPLHPHSPSLQVLVEQGAVGLILSSLGLYLLLRAWRNRHEADIAKALSGAMVMGYLVAGVSSFGIWQNWWIAVLWIGFALQRWLARSA